MSEYNRIYNNDEYLRRVESSRRRMATASRTEAEKLSNAAQLEIKLRQKVKKLESGAYAYASRQKQKKMRSEASSKDLNRWCK